MATRNRKGQFVKGHGATRRRRGGGSKALVIREQISVAAPRRRTGGHRVVHHKKHHRRRGHGHGLTAVKIVGSAIFLGSAAETNNGPLGPSLYNVVQKLPGVKTFGGAVTAGLYLGAVGKFTRLGRGRIGPWLRAAGIVGLVGAGLKMGAQGTKFQWLGGDAPPDPFMRVR